MYVSSDGAKSEGLSLGSYRMPEATPEKSKEYRITWFDSPAATRALIEDPEGVTNKMYCCNIDIEVTLSGSLICARVVG